MCVTLVAALLWASGSTIWAAHRSPAVIATIPVGFDFPLGLAVDSVSNRIYVAGGTCCSGGPGGAVSVIDGATHTLLATIPVTAGALYAAVNPLANRLYVTHGNGTADIVSVIDTIGNVVLTTIPTGQSPFGIAVNLIANRVYVVNNRSHTVSVIDGATNTIVATIPTPPFPLSATIDAISSRLYVTSGTNVAVIDLLTNAVVDTIPDRDDSLAFGIGLDPLLNRLYVPRFSGELGGTVAVVDIAARAVAGSVAVGSQPNGVAVNPTASRVYVGVRSANAVAVIDSAANQHIGVVNVGSVPFDVAANVVTDRVYVANTLSHTVSVLADVADLSVDISDAPDPVLPGHEVTYTSIVTNHGGSPATGVTFDQILQSKFGGAPQVTSSQGTCTVSESAVSCGLGTIAAGASATVTVTIRVTKPGTVTTTASVAGSEFDPSTSNNSDVESTSVVPGPPNEQGH